MTAEMATVFFPGRPGAALDVWDSIWGLAQERGLKVGDQLPSIRELSERLEVNPTAVRDALLRAQTRGLVRVLPRAGAFLKTTPAVATPHDLADVHGPAFQSRLREGEHNLFHLLDARQVIEIELVGRAAERRRLEDLLPIRRALDAMLQLPDDAPRAEYVNHDIRFHVEIARVAGNAALFAVQQTLMELLRPHLIDIPKDLQRRSNTDRSHAAIYQALVAGEADKARSEMRQHLSLAYDGLLRDIQAPPAIDRRPPCPGDKDSRPR